MTHQPYPHVRRNLIIPTSPRMQFPTDIFPDNLGKPAFVGGVDVFVVGLDLELTCQPS